MKTKHGFYTSTLEEEGMEFDSLNEQGELVVINDLGRKELYAQNNDFAGWTLEYNGNQYEFVRSL